MEINCRQILKVVGAARVAREIGVTEKSTNRAANLNVFPAGWYFVLRVMCAEAGVECPVHLFTFKVGDVINFETATIPTGLHFNDGVAA